MTRYPALARALEYCEKHSITLPIDLAVTMFCIGAAKSEEYFGRNLDRIARSLYRGTIDETEFVQLMSDLIGGQLRRAWEEGMAQNNLSPEDMTEEWQGILDDIISNEREYIVGFGDAIEEARADGKPIDGIYARADLWVARYPDVVSRAQVITAPKDLNFRWVYGDTVEHCADCEAMVNAGVQSAEYWAERQAEGIYPKSPDLSCSGFHCDCRLDSTDEKPNT